jgi:hypothetical protein
MESIEEENGNLRKEEGMQMSRRNRTMNEIIKENKREKK